MRISLVTIWKSTVGSYRSTCIIELYSTDLHKLFQKIFTACARFYSQRSCSELRSAASHSEGVCKVHATRKQWICGQNAKASLEDNRLSFPAHPGSTSGSKNFMHYEVGHAPRMICGRACTTNDFLCMHYEWSCDLLQKLLTALECWENSVSEACAHVPNRKNLAACAREIWTTFGLLFGLLFK